MYTCEEHKLVRCTLFQLKDEKLETNENNPKKYIPKTAPKEKKSHEGYYIYTHTHKFYIDK